MVTIINLASKEKYTKKYISREIVKLFQIL